MNKEFVVVTEAINEQEAVLICDVLRAEGIDALTEGEMGNRMLRTLSVESYVKILVPRDEAPRAKNLLEKIPKMSVESNKRLRSSNKPAKTSR